MSPTALWVLVFSMAISNCKAIWLLGVLLVTSRSAMSSSSSSSFSDAYDGDDNENVVQACSVTRYRDLCIHSLASYSKTPKNNYPAWARAGVSVALTELKNATHYLENLKNSSRSSPFFRGATEDCVECFHDAVSSLHQSLAVLRQLDVVTFDLQLADVTTWLSSALTDEDTCLDGFEEDRVRATQRRMRRERTRVDLERVRNCSYVTSNALSLVNKLASTGL